MRPRRSRVRKPPDLTSLFDVLFIVVFASLIRAAAAEKAAMPVMVEPVKVSPTVAGLQARALADLRADLAARSPLVVRVSETGMLTALETGAQKISLDAPLLEASTNPDVALAYLGDRSADLRVCRLAALHLGAPDLSKYLVIFAPARPLRELPHALYEGLHRDVDRCFAEQHGVASIVDPTGVKPAENRAP